jgi:type II secretory pathway pseudopilin PulG
VRNTLARPGSTELRSGMMIRMTGRRRSVGFTLLELAIGVIVMVIIFSYASPKYWEATEQARVDLAGRRLIMIYTAQRLYYADNQAFSTSLANLVTANTLDQYLPPGSGSDGEFSYTVTSGSALQFTATATRLADSYWSGSISLNERGEFTGWVNNSDSSIKLTPPTTSNGL